ncbi:MAG: hypothetical protein GY943_36110 [Chloroflexi bacterium]|nr:hypothetical protein [Chloroflexota bacterium]
MADLTADAYLKIHTTAESEIWTLDNSAAQTIYKGQPMIIDQSEDTVYLRGFVDATTVAATDIFVGIAAEGASVATADTETDNTIEVFVEGTKGTVIGFPGSVFTDADVGDPVYMSDSATLSATVGDNPVIGKLVRVRDGFQYVRLSSPTICSGA